MLRLEYVNPSDHTKNNTMDELTKKSLLLLAPYISISLLVDDEELVWGGFLPVKIRDLVNHPDKF